MDEAFDEKIALRWAFVVRVACLGYEAEAVPAPSASGDGYTVCVYEDIVLPEGVAQAAVTVLHTVREARAFVRDTLNFDAQYA